MNHKIQLYLKKIIIYLGLPVLSVITVGFLLFYFFVQSNLDEFKVKLTQEISQQFDKQVEIESITAQWRITNPSLTLFNLSIYNNSLEKSFNLKKIRIDISWLSLLKFKLILDEITLYGPNLDIEKFGTNKYLIGGIPIQTSKNSSASNWILNQDEIIIVNGKIKWQDHTRDAPTLLVDNISVRYESSTNISNHNRHNFIVTGQLSSLKNQLINIYGYFDSSSVEKIKNSNGQLSLSVEAVDINTFRPWVDYPAEIISATGDINIRGDFNDGRITQIDSQLDVQNFITKINKSNEEPLTLKNFKGQISYEIKKNITTLTIPKFDVITDNGININQGEFSLSINNVKKKINQIRIGLNRINLQSAHELIRHLPYTKSFQSIIQEVSPTGQLKDLKLNWVISNNQFSGLTLQSQLLNVSVDPYQNFPGIKNLTGIVDIKKTRGSIKSVSKDLTIIKKDIFRQPITFSQFSGLIKWKNNLFNLKDIVIQNNDVNSIVNGSYKYNAHQDSIVDLVIKMPIVNLPSLKKYYPLQIGEKALHWLDTSLLKGQAQNTTIKLKGKTQDFPFVNTKNEPDDEKGIFTVESTIIDSFIEYGEGWPELNDFDFKINILNNTINFESIQGDLLGNNVVKMIGTISPFNIEEPMMNIDLTLDSPIPKIIDAINKSPIKQVMRGFFDGMEGEGPGQLAVKLKISLKDEDNISFKGSYEFQNSYLINNNKGIPKITNILGYVEFDENYLSINDTKANLSGSPITIALNNIGDITQVNIDGIINKEFVRSTLGKDWANKITGETSWNSEIKIKDEATSIKIQSNLKGLSSNLPSPFDKKANDVKTLLLTTESINSNQDIISLEIGTDVFAKLIKENNYEGAFGIKNGVISINSGQINIPNEGVFLSAELNKVNLETFYSLLNNFKSSPSNPLITNANINIQELDIYGYKIINSNIKYLPSNNNSSIQILSNDVIGNILWSKVDNIFKAGFEKLHLKTNNVLNENKFIFSNPPKINIKAKSLMVNEDAYGDLSITAFKEDKVWNIQNFKITNATHTLNGTGLWIDEGLDPNTSINFTWNINNIQKTFDQLSYPELIKDGKASVIGMLSWPNSPFDFDKSSLQGNFSLTATDGVVLEAKPGVARLFGLLTLQNLPRRLSLDFSDIFSKGFIFDRIDAGVIVNKGVLKSNRFTMEGPAAEVTIKGETNIIEETQNIHVVVEPRISDSLSLLSLAGGPLVGAAAFIAQKILEDPLNKILSDEYQIIGTWDEPEEIVKPRSERFGEMIEQEILKPSSKFLNIN
jgi:uncharacterized protein (TIGR02099 family)